MNSTQKGEEYERQIYDVENKKRPTFIWKDVPEQHLLNMGLGKSLEKFRGERKNTVNTIQDRGIDLISVDIEEEMFIYNIVQCKNYEKNISETECGSFFSRETECFHLFDKEICRVNSTICSNSKFTPQLVNSTSYLNKFRAPFTRTLEHFPYCENPCLKKSSLPKEDWIHSKLAVEQILEEFKSNNRVILANPCRTGKTKIAYQVWTKSMKKFDYLFFFSFLRSTTLESKNAFLNYNIELKVEVISMDGDDKLNAKKNTAYFVCDQSIDKVIDFILNNQEKCLVMVDEFHNLPKSVVLDEDSDFYKLYHSEVNILNISFTPRVYELDNEDVEEDLFGNVVKTITVEEAIQKNIINDFNIWIPKISESNKVIDDHLSEIDVSHLHDKHCIHWLLHGMLLHGYRKCIYYAQSIDEC